MPWRPKLPALSRLTPRLNRVVLTGAAGVCLGGIGLGSALVALAAPEPIPTLAWSRRGIAAAPGDAPSQSLAQSQGLQVRVLLQQAPALEPSAPSGPLRLLDSRNRELALLSGGEALRIRREGGLLWLERVGATPQSLPLQELWLVPAPAAMAGPTPGPVSRLLAALQNPLPLMGLAGRRYRGLLQIRPEGSQLQAVNHIPLEHYLPSVVGSEMPARWPAAALQAQAVAARTYALAQRKPAAPFDLRATVASQAYLGVEAETDSTRAAVAATRSQVLRHGGSLIDAVFHSSSGGSTENSGELWNQQLPYLVSVPDQDSLSPWHQWRLRIEPDQLRRAFREIDGANRIDVLTTSSTGRVRRARVIGPAGSLELSGAELRQRLGLRSTLVRFRFELPPTAPAGGGISAAVIEAQGQPRSLAGMAAGGPRTLPPLPALPSLRPVAPGNSTPAIASSPPADTGSNASLIEAPVALSALEVEGRGFGHGVGMSQWGAYGLALRGLGYEQILRHYYRGAQLVSAPTP